MSSDPRGVARAPSAGPAAEAAPLREPRGEPASDPLLGRAILQYRIERKLGAGGMGAVYLALQERMGKRAAVKVLHPHLSSEARSLERFFNEARAATMVKHPGLVDLYDCGQLEDGLAFILMEYLEGDALSQRMEAERRAGRSFPLAWIRQLGAQLAATLAATHAQGIIHRDLKPENIFLVPDPVAPGGERSKILDFGIAKFKDPVGRKTTVGLILGTPTYMAPEQCEGREDLTDRVDVYALGVLLYELCAGAPPFVAETASSLLRQHMFKEAPSLGALRPELPEELVVLVGEMLQKEPAARPGMGEVAARLGGAAAPQRGRPPSPRRGRARAILVLGLALGALVLAGALALRRGAVAPVGSGGASASSPGSSGGGAPAAAGAQGGPSAEGAGPPAAAGAPGAASAAPAAGAPGAASAAPAAGVPGAASAAPAAGAQEAPSPAAGATPARAGKRGHRGAAAAVRGPARTAPHGAPAAPTPGSRYEVFDHEPN